MIQKKKHLGLESFNQYYLLLSVYLIIFAFFVILLNFSTIQKQKLEKALESFDKIFSTYAREPLDPGIFIIKQDVGNIKNSLLKSISIFIQKQDLAAEAIFDSKSETMEIYQNLEKVFQYKSATLQLHFRNFVKKLIKYMKQDITIPLSLKILLPLPPNPTISEQDLAQQRATSLIEILHKNLPYIHNISVGITRNTQEKIFWEIY